MMLQGAPGSPERPRRRASLRAAVLVGLVVLVGVLFVGVFPTRTYLAQRGDLADTERRLEVLASQNRELAERAARLNTDAEIERLAREQYNLVRPGEEAFAILPAPSRRPAPRPAPKKAPGLWARVWDDITFWS